MIGTQGGFVFSGSVGIQCRGSNVFYAKDTMPVAILCKKDGPTALLMLCLEDLKAITKVVVHGIVYEN